jgi:predicted HicB family RNase H-like nuclease
MRYRAPGYDRRISFVMPPSLYEAVTAAADEKMQSINAWLRQACLSKLEEGDVDRRDVQRRATPR